MTNRADAPPPAERPVGEWLTMDRQEAAASAHYADKEPEELGDPSWWFELYQRWRREAVAQRAEVARLTEALAAANSRADKHFADWRIANDHIANAQAAQHAAESQRDAALALAREWAEYAKWAEREYGGPSPERFAGQYPHEVELRLLAELDAITGGGAGG